MKTYALICKDFGRKFSFNAKDEADAISKAKGWCRYHSHSWSDYTVLEANEPYKYEDLHNEYVER